MPSRARGTLAGRRELTAQHLLAPQEVQQRQSAVSGGAAGGKKAFHTFHIAADVSIRNIQFQPLRLFAEEGTVQSNGREIFQKKRASRCCQGTGDGFPMAIGKLRARADTRWVYREANARYAAFPLRKAALLEPWWRIAIVNPLLSCVWLTERGGTDRRSSCVERRIESIKESRVHTCALPKYLDRQVDAIRSRFWIFDKSARRGDLPQGKSPHSICSGAALLSAALLWLDFRKQVCAAAQEGRG